MTTTTPHPVNSAFYPCCHAIGRHGPDCATRNLSVGDATMPSMDTTPTHTTADAPMIRRLRFAEDILMTLHANLLREGADTPLVDAERLHGLYDAASRLLKAADEVRDVRHDVAALSVAAHSLARVPTAELREELHRRGLTDDDIAAEVGITAEEVAALP